MATVPCHLDMSLDLSLYVFSDFISLYCSGGLSKKKVSPAKPAGARGQPVKKAAVVQAARKTGVDLAAKSGCSLWVRNIATTTRANDLKTHFSQYGAVRNLFGFSEHCMR